MDFVLAEPRIAAAVPQLGRGWVKGVVAEVLDECRLGLLAPQEVAAAVVERLPGSPTSFRAVINATGIVVHTNLGRAPLSAAAVDALKVAAGATDVEFDLTTGLRGPRGAGAVGALSAAVPAAGAAHVVNNGAAALALVACVLGQGREVVIARGELVEIGDGFRIPELLESLGVRLVEVGTTNRVRFADYQAAVSSASAFVLKVHPSNFRVEGFTSSVSVTELRDLRVPVVADIGSGLLAPHPRLPDEPDAETVLRAGADLVTASGDKLLGGPQCGLLLGDAELVHRLRRHPFARALRVDKLTLAALEATLRGPTPPVVASLSTSPDESIARATRLAHAIGDTAEAVRSEAHVGGGGAPGVQLPSAAIALDQHLADALRLGEPAIVGRVQGGRLLLDLITVPPDLDDVLVEAVRRASRGGSG